LKYSIIIPTLNEEKLLPNILNQIKQAGILELYEAELIISDGASTDATVSLARDFTHKIVCHTRPERQNISEGRNAGAKYAEGEILIFLGADIVFQDIRAFFEFVSNRFLPGRYLAMTCNVKVFPNEERLSDRFFHSILNTYFYLLNVFGVGMGRGECQVIRREVFLSFKGYNETLAAGEDFDLFKRVRRKGKILYARDLCVFESPRRYRKLGYLRVCKLWFINAFYVIFKKKSLAQEWEQIR
jgi:glycosyltransferase involved in cell wall biosynthesis